MVVLCCCTVPANFVGGVVLTDAEALRLEESERHRDLLNTLVTESAGKTDAQVCWYTAVQYAH